MAYVAEPSGPTLAHLAPVPGKHLFGAIARFFVELGAAIRVSAAIEARRQPDARDMETLGLKGLSLPLPR